MVELIKKSSIAMVDLNAFIMIGFSQLTTTLALLGTASFMIIIAYFSTSYSYSKLSGNRKEIIAKLAVGVILGLLSVYATLMSTKLPDGTAPNVRELAAMIAGVTGGPVGGLLAGLIGGIHRFSIGGATALPCGLATVLVGVVSGVLSTKLVGKRYLLKAAALGFVLESVALGLLFVLAPLDVAVSVASQVYVPMVVASTIGLVLWTYLLNKWKIRQN